MTEPPSPRIRISDADREKAAARLHEALGEGRITLAELEERLGVVYAARYEDELREPLADLPGAVVVPVVPATTEPLVLRTGMASLKRSGRWSVPARLRVESAMGSVVLDFSETELPHPVIDVELQVGAGSAKLVLPPGATADVDGVVSGMGHVRCKVPSIPRNGVPHFRVTGRSAMGSVVVRYPLKFRDWFS